jgi:hypothetical protein
VCRYQNTQPKGRAGRPVGVMVSEYRQERKATFRSRTPIALAIRSFPFALEGKLRRLSFPYYYFFARAIDPALQGPGENEALQAGTLLKRQQKRQLILEVG